MHRRLLVASSLALSLLATPALASTSAQTVDEVVAYRDVPTVPVFVFASVGALPTPTGAFDGDAEVSRRCVGPDLEVAVAFSGAGATFDTPARIGGDPQQAESEVDVFFSDVYDTTAYFAEGAGVVAEVAGPATVLWTFTDGCQDDQDPEPEAIKVNVLDALEWVLDKFGVDLAIDEDHWSFGLEIAIDIAGIALWLLCKMFPNLCAFFDG